MKKIKIAILATFIVAAGSSFATQSQSSLTNNRRNASCTPIEGTCVLSGEHLCDEQQQYELSDESCAVRFNKKP